MLSRFSPNGKLPRDERGRVFTRRCVDPNCDGQLVPDEEWGQHRWRCNGLTYRGEGYPLEACSYSHHDSEVADWRVAELATGITYL